MGRAWPRRFFQHALDLESVGEPSSAGPGGGERRAASRGFGAVRTPERSQKSSTNGRARPPFRKSSKGFDHEGRG